MPTILNPLFWIPKIQCQIRNQRPQKPWSTKFHENRWLSKILCPPFQIPKIPCQIQNQRPRKLFSTEFCGNCVVFQNYMSDILDIRHFAKGIAIWDRWDNFFLATQLCRSPLIIVRIKSQYSFRSNKKLWKKKIPDSLVLFSKFGAILDFLLDETQFWPWILEEHTQNYKEIWVSYKNFSFSVMRMRLEHKSKNRSSWSLMG